MRHVWNAQSREYNKNPKRQEYMRKFHKTKKWKKYADNYIKEWRKRPENKDYAKNHAKVYLNKPGVKERIKKYRLSINARYNLIKKVAKVRNLSFYLSKKKYKEIISKNCHYCKKDLLNTEIGISLDRINNNLGYSLKNVLPCCGVCNKIRNKHLTVEEMEVVIKSLLKFRKKKSLNWSVKDK